MSDSTATGARTAGTTNEVRGRTTDDFNDRVHQDETKPSFMTTELWVMVAGIVALIVTYNVAEDASLDLFRVCLLATMAGMAYVVSRGLAKAGSARRTEDSRQGGRSYR